MHDVGWLILASFDQKIIWHMRQVENIKNNSNDIDLCEKKGNHKYWKVKFIQAAHIFDHKRVIGSVGAFAPSQFFSPVSYKWN